MHFLLYARNGAQGASRSEMPQRAWGECPTERRDAMVFNVFALLLFVPCGYVVVIDFNRLMLDS